jgi:hypothetical protein
MQKNSIAFAKNDKEVDNFQLLFFVLSTTFINKKANSKTNWL